MSKLDDSSGFHLSPLHEDSRDLCCFMFGGRVFQYLVLPFGERKSPSTYQRLNFMPINFLRHMGIILSLYLDDRLVAEVKDKYMTIANGKDYEQFQDMALDTFLTLCIIVAAGGFINMSKSTFKPKFVEEFLGMILDTSKCVISVPQEKWENFIKMIQVMLEKGITNLEDLEKLRGNAASFIIAAKHLKYFIREMTIEIAKVYSNNKNKLHRMFKKTKIVVTKHLRHELLEWIKCDLLEVKRCWLPPMDLGRKKVSLHTDSSLCQLGGVLYHGKLKVGEFKRGFQEELR